MSTSSPRCQGCQLRSLQHRRSSAQHISCHGRRQRIDHLCWPIRVYQWKASQYVDSGGDVMSRYCHVTLFRLDYAARARRIPCYGWPLSCVVGVIHGRIRPR